MTVVAEYDGEGLPVEIGPDYISPEVDSADFNALFDPADDYGEKSPEYIDSQVEVNLDNAVVDSDGDGVPDAAELIAGTDPLDPDDFP